MMTASVPQLAARLRKNPNDMEAFAALRAHYQGAEDHASLANLLEGWAALFGDDEAAAAAYYEAGELCLGTLEDLGRAVDLYRRALERHPLHFDASLRLQGIYEELEDFSRLVDLFRSRIENLRLAGAERSDIAMVHHQLGDLWDQVLGDPDEALSQYTLAYQTDPNAVAAIYAARQLHQDRGELDEVARLYRLEATAEARQDRAIALLRELAFLQAEGLHNLSAAVETLARAVGDHPHNDALRNDLASVLLARATERPSFAQDDLRAAADNFFFVASSAASGGQATHDQAFPYLRAALNACPAHDDALELWMGLGAGPGELAPRWVAYLQAAPSGPLAPVLRIRLGQAYLAQDQLFDAVACLEPLLPAGDVEAADILADCYHRLGQEDRRVEALTLAATRPGPAGAVRAHELIELLEERGSRTGAIDIAQDLLRRVPNDPIALPLVEETLRRKQDWRGLRDVLLEAAARDGGSAAERTRRLVEAARISIDKLDDSSAALSAWQYVVSLNPNDSRAREAIEKLLEQAAKWDELAQTIEHEANQAPTHAERAEKYLRLASIHRAQRNDVHETLRALEKARELLPHDTAVRDDLCQLFLEAGEQARAIPLLWEQVAEAKHDERVALLRRLGAIFEGHIHDFERAYAVQTEILALRPLDAHALDAVERIDRITERWDRLIETLSYRCERAEGAARGSVLLEMGALAERHLGDLERAGEYITEAFSLMPIADEVLEIVVRCYEQLGKIRDVVALLKARAQNEDDPNAQVAVLRRIARLLGGRVGNLEAARETWERVLAMREDEEALRFLVSDSDPEADRARHIDMLGRLAACTASPTEATALRTEQARLLEHAEPSEALEILEGLVAGDAPLESQALLLTMELAERTERWGTLATALEQLLALTNEGGQRITELRWSAAQRLAAVQQLAALFDGRIDDPARAEKALTIWAELSPQDPQPRARLLPLLVAEGQRHKRLQCLEALARITQNGTERRRCLQEAAALAEALGEVTRAFEVLVWGVAAGDQALEAPLGALAERHGRHAALAATYLQLARDEESVPKRIHFWRAAAEILEAEGDRPGALEAMLRALACDLGRMELLAEVERLAVSLEAWERLEAVHRNVLDTAPDVAARTQWLIRFGTALRDHAPDRALDRFLEACALDPHDDTPFLAAEAVATSPEAMERVLRALVVRAAQCDDAAMRVTTLLRCAARLADSGETSESIRTLLAAVDAAVGEPSLLSACEQAARTLSLAMTPESGTAGATRAPASDAESVDPIQVLVEFYRTFADRCSGEHMALGASLLSRAANLLDREGEEDQAFSLFRRAVTLGPRCTDQVTELINFGRRTGRLEEVETIIGQLVEDSVDRSDAVSLLSLEAMMLDEDLERPSAALDAYRRILTLQPEHPVALARTVALLKQLGRYEDLLLILEQRAQRGGGAQRSDWLRDIARTWEIQLHNRWEALDAWSRVLAADADDREAHEAIKRLSTSRPPAPVPEGTPVPASNSPTHADSEELHGAGAQDEGLVRG